MTVLHGWDVRNTDFVWKWRNLNQRPKGEQVDVATSPERICSKDRIGDLWRTMMIEDPDTSVLWLMRRVTGVRYQKQQQQQQQLLDVRWWSSLVLWRRPDTVVRWVVTCEWETTMTSRAPVSLGLVQCAVALLMFVNVVNSLQTDTEQRE